MMPELLKAIAVCAIAFAAAPAAADQVAKSSTSSTETDLDYLVYTPGNYEGSEETFPLIVWLHGGDQGGPDIEKVRTSGLPRMIEEGQELPFVVFSPQNPSEELLYPIERVKAALDEVMAEYRVDPTRVYLAGYSRGGFGAWAMAQQYPETFAAVVPIAGGGVRHYLNRTNEKTAFWAFHGAEDEVIPLSDTVVLVQRLEELEREVKLTVFENTDHEQVEAATLGEPKLWDWLLEHRLEAPEPTTTP